MSRIVPQRFFRRSRRRWGDDEILVFAGTASPRLTASICRHLELDRARGEVLRFSEGTLFVRVLENVRGRNVYVV
jgi:ribose-phosphate pyrophosphokinase